MTDTYHPLSPDLRAITLDASDNPRRGTLHLDEMFTRVSAWGEARARSLAMQRSSSSQSGSKSRAASPSRISTREPFPLPRPLADDCPSPLRGVLAYPELLPLVLREFEHPRELAVLCRVCKEFDYLARRRLYERIWIRPWEEGCHSKLTLLFRTLSIQPELCEMIKQLDVRFFPLATRGGERYDLEEQVRSAMQSMTRLQSLVWTRDKSLHPELLEIITRLPSLQKLEISGHSYRYYDPSLLARMPLLEDLRVMMPDSHFKEALQRIIRELDQRPMGGLRGLAIVHRSSPLIDDAALISAAPHLSHLRRLNLWGCSRITKKSIDKVLEHAENIEELSLDALPHSEMHDMFTLPALPKLQTYSLSFTVSSSSALALPRLPPCPSLTSLHFTLAGARAPLPLDFVHQLSTQIDLSQLVRLSLLNLLITRDQLSPILKVCTALEELFISSADPMVIDNTQALSRSHLTTFHITGTERTLPRADGLAHLASAVPTITQLGSSNRIYEVYRREGKVELGRWARTEIPRYFQVWRG